MALVSTSSIKLVSLHFIGLLLEVRNSFTFELPLTIIQGNRVCLRHIIEAGADLSAKSNDGKTPLAMAHELKSIGAYRRALADCGRNEDGSVREKPLSDVCFSVIWRIILNNHSAEYKYRNIHFTSFLHGSNLLDSCLSAILHGHTHSYWRVLRTISHCRSFTSISPSTNTSKVSKVLLDSRGQSNELVKTPFLAAIVLSSMIWLTYCWVTRLVWSR